MTTDPRINMSRGRGRGTYILDPSQRPPELRRPHDETSEILGRLAQTAACGGNILPDLQGGGDAGSILNSPLQRSITNPVMENVPRQPITSPSYQTKDNSLEPDIGAGGDVLRTSKLSADALEFYPKSFFEEAQPNSSLHPTLSTRDYVGRHSQQGRLQKQYTSPPYYQATPDEDCPPTYYNLSPAQQAAGDLIEVMHRVTISPGCFDDLVKPFIESLSLILMDKETVETLADIIVEQSITEPNFRYNGARLCSFLNSKFHAGDDLSFRNILLYRCASEHDQMVNYLHNDPARLQGLGLFLSELYIQLEISQGIEERIAILGTAVYDILKQLITVPTSDNIKCVCQALKLSGWALDKDNTVSMNELIENLQKVTLFTNLNTNIAALVASILQLRQKKWGDSTNFSPEATALSWAPQKDEPVFYGPDGQIITPEESKFLQESSEATSEVEDNDEYGTEGDPASWETDNEMNEEMQDAFEQFLQMSKNKTKRG